MICFLFSVVEFRCFVNMLTRSFQLLSQKIRNMWILALFHYAKRATNKMVLKVYYTKSVVLFRHTELTSWIVPSVKSFLLRRDTLQTLQM